MQANIQIHGVDVVKDVLSRLPKTMQNKTLRPAMKKAMRVVKKKAEENLDSVLSGNSTGLLRRSLRIYAFKSRRGQLRTAVMVKKGLIYPNKFDTALRGKKGRKRTVSEPRRVGMVAGILNWGRPGQAPRFWLTKAARESVRPLYEALRQEIKNQLEKTINAVKKAA